MNILITGGTGLIGSQLVPFLATQHKLVIITRNVSMAENVLGHKVSLHSSLDHFDNLDEFDAVINLAGEPIVENRWTKKQKQRIESSRWETTQTLVDLINKSDAPPSFLISGSAIGYYGRQGSEKIDESFTDVHQEFSHSLCEKWEQIAMQAQSENTRVCTIRTGIVLSKKGGALSKMLMPFKMGLGGPIGNGMQYMSWIHIQDLLRAMQFLLDNQTCQGPFNFTAPNPVENKVFAQTFAKRLKRPAIFPMPAFVLRIMMGEMSDLLLFGQNVVPAKLLEKGFEFAYPSLEQALESFPFKHK
jgi:uncharacterized protein (TIGR01777 family)